MKITVSSYSSEIIHIGKRDKEVYRLNCGRKILSDNANEGYGSRRCQKCGTDEDFEHVRAGMHQRAAERAAERAEQAAAQTQRLALRNEQRRVLAPAIQAALEFIGATVEIKHFAAGATLTGEFEVDGEKHRFEMKLKR